MSPGRSQEHAPMPALGHATAYVNRFSHLTILLRTYFVLVHIGNQLKVSPNVMGGVYLGLCYCLVMFVLSVVCVLQRTAHGGSPGATLRTDTFTDLDYADDVALPVETIDVLLLTLDL